MSRFLTQIPSGPVYCRLFTGTADTREQPMILEDFMTDERKRSMQHDFGVMWTDNGRAYPQYRVSYIQDTGELYAVKLAVKSQAEVEILGVIAPGEGGDWDAPAERVLGGWDQLNSSTWTLDWIRERMRAWMAQQDTVRITPGQLTIGEPATGKTYVLDTVIGGLRVSADLPGLPGVPAEVSPVRCDDCRQNTAVLRHEDKGPDEPMEITISCSSCGSIIVTLPGHVDTYLAGLYVGTLIEAARNALS